MDVTLDLAQPREIPQMRAAHDITTRVHTCCVRVQQMEGASIAVPAQRTLQYHSASAPGLVALCRTLGGPYTGLCSVTKCSPDVGFP